MLSLCTIWNTWTLFQLGPRCPNSHPAQREDLRPTSWLRREKIHIGIFLLPGGHLGINAGKHPKGLRHRSDVYCYDTSCIMQDSVLYFPVFAAQNRQITTAPKIPSFHFYFMQCSTISWEHSPLQSTPRLSPNGKYVVACCFSFLLQIWSIASIFYLHQKHIYHISRRT